MKTETRALCRELLRHHAAQVEAYPPKARINPALYTVRYGELCRRAGVPHLTRIVGGFLGEIAEWCRDSGFPPLNALVVNETGGPGDGFDGAGGFRLNDWAQEVEACIRFTEYPDEPPRRPTIATRKQTAP